MKNKDKVFAKADTGKPTDEEWKDIPGYEGYYQVSNLGRVKRIGGFVQWNSAWGPKKMYYNRRILKAELNMGYPTVNLCKNNKTHVVRVHRLVAQTFIENPYNKPQVNHKDGNRKNNCVENLEWVTNKENQEHSINVLHNTHAYWRGKTRSLEFNKKIKEFWKTHLHPRSKKVRCVELNLIFNSIHDARRKLNISGSKINASCNNKKRTSNGYHWEWVYE